jgi:hypothetical protein
VLDKTELMKVVVVDTLMQEEIPQSILVELPEVIPVAIHKVAAEEQVFLVMAELAVAVLLMVEQEGMVLAEGVADTMVALAIMEEMAEMVLQLLNAILLAKTF